MPINISSLRLHFLCGYFALGSFVWGYNIGILSTVYVHPGFKQALGHPSSSQTGLITAIYYLGTWLSYLFLSHPTSDLLGRRYAALVGMLVACFGSALIAGASGGPSGAYTMVIIGRIIGGLGIAVVSTSVPLYQSEIAPPKQRGKLVVMNHIGLVAGLAVAFWVGYGISHWDSPRGSSVGWRVSISLQFFPAAIMCLGMPFVPETPRWLLLRHRADEALKSLIYFREGTFSDEQIRDELQDIHRSIGAQMPTFTRWLELFSKPALFQRLWRAALLQFMAQMCGATAMKYYLPTLFRKLSLGTRLALMVGGIESTLKIGCTVIEMMIVDRAGRRNTMAAGALGMSIAMLINGALPIVYPNNANRASDYACIVFIFIYTFSYSLGFGPGAWVYGSEIFPTTHRAVGLNVAASFGAIGSIVTAQVWPVGIDNVGSNIYFYFMAINLACVPVIWFLYPETKKRPLETINVLFDNSDSIAQDWRSSRVEVINSGFGKEQTTVNIAE
ncbi:uncharacterized protein PV09_03316 [Verruconis gallopava]|uniref:Major facilitator superfamily (MFS) profile domain-containing protein n=1 Tax=Verruconis gallopava TaxID=253628 RepID=A0A0D2B4J5_9PEZI|nr:uncharacterized protein PV09_03316 [Verruconis gallopava]KIW06154.1 hypothetical protein PV09_03316 [Verruconis gallopava]